MTARPLSLPHDGPRLAGALILCFAASFLGSAATQPQIATWYAALIKPALTPPNWVFPVVWTALFLLMAISLWRVVRQGASPARNRALIAFALQLVCNVAWSFAFFAARSPAAGLVVAVGLVASVALWAYAAGRVERLAGVLQTPYLAWVSFALFLNLQFVVLNP